MDFIQVLLALVCVLAISIGQILFKQAGLEIQAIDNWFNLKVMAIICIAGIIYGSATLLWIYLLKTVDLSRIYIFMALSFIIVPIASNIIFDERLSFGFFVGMALVLAGIFVVVRYGQ